VIGYSACVDSQQSSTNFNERLGRNLLRFRKAANISQAALADQLEKRGFPFGQTTIVKVEQGTRPLKAEELVAIGEILEIPTSALLEYTDAEERQAATAQLENAVAGIVARRERIAELEDEIRHSEILKREAERRLAALEDGADG
jgi:transcriptional regulator with XRE-family HTH domain